MPQMLPVHFGMFRQLLILEGYKVDMLTTNHRGIVDEAGVFLQPGQVHRDDGDEFQTRLFQGLAQQVDIIGCPAAAPRLGNTTRTGASSSPKR